MRTKIEQTADGVVLSIPGPSFGPGRLLRLVVALVIAGIAAFIVLPGLRSLPAPALIRYLITGFVILFAVVMPVLSVIRTLAGSPGSRPGSRSRAPSSASKGDSAAKGKPRKYRRTSWKSWNTSTGVRCSTGSKCRGLRNSRISAIREHPAFPTGGPSQDPPYPHAADAFTRGSPRAATRSP